MGALPDPHCTPGSIDPAVNQDTIHSTICVRGYTTTIQPPASETNAFKYNEAYPAYDISPGTQTELNHLIPLKTGGSNDASNLWPENLQTAGLKDKVENDLHAAVCSGKVTLAAAQLAIARDWMTAEKALGLS